MNDDRPNILRSEGGSLALVLVAMLLTAVLVLAGFAIDVGRAYVVRRELQHAADATSLAGAATFYSSALYAPPMWSTALVTATGFVGQNKAAGQSLVDADIQYGWWNLDSRSWKAESPVTSGSPPGKAQGYCWGARSSICTTDDDCGINLPCLIREVPGLVTTTGRPTPVNVPATFARAVGWSQFTPISRPSVAVQGRIGSLGPNNVFPWAVTKDTAAKIQSESGVSANITISNQGEDLYHSGQWTSFLDQNTIPTISGIVSTGNNPVQLSVGQSIYIAQGAKENLLHQVPTDFNVLLPVVPNPSDGKTLNNTGNTALPIIGFIGFHISSVQLGSKAGLNGYYWVPPPIPTEGITGGDIGSYTPPVLVQ